MKTIISFIVVALLYFATASAQVAYEVIKIGNDTHVVIKQNPPEILGTFTGDSALVNRYGETTLLQAYHEGKVMVSKQVACEYSNWGIQKKWFASMTYLVKENNRIFITTSTIPGGKQFAWETIVYWIFALWAGVGVLLVLKTKPDKRKGMRYTNLLLINWVITLLFNFICMVTMNIQGDLFGITIATGLSIATLVLCGCLGHLWRNKKFPVIKYILLAVTVSIAGTSIAYGFLIEQWPALMIVFILIGLGILVGYLYLRHRPKATEDKQI